MVLASLYAAALAATIQATDAPSTVVREGMVVQTANKKGSKRVGGTNSKGKGSKYKGGTPGKKWPAQPAALVALSRPVR